MFDDQDPLEEEAHDYKNLIPSNKIKKEKSIKSKKRKVSSTEFSDDTQQIEYDGGNANDNDENGGNSKNRLRLFVDYFEIVSTVRYKLIIFCLNVILFKFFLLNDHCSKEL